MKELGNESRAICRASLPYVILSAPHPGPEASHSVEVLVSSFRGGPGTWKLKWKVKTQLSQECRKRGPLAAQAGEGAVA